MGVNEPHNKLIIVMPQKINNKCSKCTKDTPCFKHTGYFKNYSPEIILQ